MSYKGIAKSFNEMWTLSLNRHGKKQDPQFISKVVKSEWLGQIEGILDGATRVVDCIRNAEENVLIYCPSGGAGTPLLSSLAQIQLEPYYRTFEGFRVLVLKVWVYYRHNFLQKNHTLYDTQQVMPDASPSSPAVVNNGIGMAAYANALFNTNVGRQAPIPEKRIEPIFFLFLDSVAQLIKQNPLAFEITSEYLAKLASLIYTNRYFEFVQSDDSLNKPIEQPKQMQKSQVKVPTGGQKQNDQNKMLSAFDELRGMKGNSAYNKEYIGSSLNNSPGRKSLVFDKKSLTYWEEYFGRFEEISPAPVEQITKQVRLNEFRSKNQQMIDKIIGNLVAVQKLRNTPNDLAFTQQFLTEHD